MAEHPATTTYLIAEPFPEALKLVRHAFVAQGLKVSKEVNISSRILQSLLIGTEPCVVLLVSLAPDCCTGGLAPMHVVVSSRGSQSEVHILGLLAPDAALLDPPATDALNRLQAGILQAVEKIGMRVILTA